MLRRGGWGVTRTHCRRDEGTLFLPICYVVIISILYLLALTSTATPQLFSGLQTSRIFLPLNLFVSLYQSLLLTDCLFRRSVFNKNHCRCAVATLRTVLYTYIYIPMCVCVCKRDISPSPLHPADIAYSLNGGYQNTINNGERREKNLRHEAKFVQVSERMSE